MVLLIQRECDFDKTGVFKSVPHGNLEHVARKPGRAERQPRARRAETRARRAESSSAPRGNQGAPRGNLERSPVVWKTCPNFLKAWPMKMELLPQSSAILTKAAFSRARRAETSSAPRGNLELAPAVRKNRPNF